MTATLSHEVDSNFDFFQRTLKDYLPVHRGRFALIRHRAIVGFFDQPGEADRAGQKTFPDGLYSIQEVADEPVDLGLYSNAGN